MEDNLNFFMNGRWTQFFIYWRRSHFFRQMEDGINFFINGRRPTFFNLEDNLNFSYMMMSFPTYQNNWIKVMVWFYAPRWATQWSIFLGARQILSRTVTVQHMFSVRAKLHTTKNAINIVGKFLYLLFISQQGTCRIINNLLGATLISLKQNHWTNDSIIKYYLPKIE